ncbi:MAG TPA: secondary thiamine-phosphate synthase enzyme YjbQ [Acidobacteriota bacterium]|nr:secondary thiamine-phosphate synthase enzyme YjbQ [Acidobacteriota bacterium]
MAVVSETLALGRTTELQMLDITGEVAAAVSRSGLRNGIVTVFNVGSTGAVTTIEFEPGLQRDFPAMLERVAPSDIPYQHDLTWHDGNGHSHTRASLLGPDITIPFIDGSLTLGTWQQLIFIELDNKPHHRKLIVQIIGE